MKIATETPQDPFHSIRVVIVYYVTINLLLVQLEINFQKYIFVLCLMSFKSLGTKLVYYRYDENNQINLVIINQSEINFNCGDDFSMRF